MICLLSLLLAETTTRGGMWYKIPTLSASFQHNNTCTVGYHCDDAVKPYSQNPWICHKKNDIPWGGIEPTGWADKATTAAGLIPGNEMQFRQVPDKRWERKCNLLGMSKYFSLYHVSATLKTGQNRAQYLTYSETETCYVWVWGKYLSRRYFTWSPAEVPQDFMRAKAKENLSFNPIESDMIRLAPQSRDPAFMPEILNNANWVRVMQHTLFYNAGGSLCRIQHGLDMTVRPAPKMTCLNIYVLKSHACSLSRCRLT